MKCKKFLSLWFVKNAYFLRSFFNHNRRLFAVGVVFPCWYVCGRGDALSLVVEMAAIGKNGKPRCKIESENSIMSLKTR